MSARVSDQQLNGQVMVSAGIGYPEFQALPPVLHSLLDLQELRVAVRKHDEIYRHIMQYVNFHGAPNHFTNEIGKVFAALRALLPEEE